MKRLFLLALLLLCCAGCSARRCPYCGLHMVGRAMGDGGGYSTRWYVCRWPLCREQWPAR